MKLAISYIRFSRKTQDEKHGGDSFRRQTAKSDDLAKRHGLTLDHSLSVHDLGVSGWHGKNAHKGNLARFLDLVREGRIPRGTTLIIESLDRLGRDSYRKMVNLIGDIMDAGITIATTDPERFYTQKNENDIGTNVEIVCILSRSLEESERKSVRIREAWAKKRLRSATEGHISTPCCPPWLRLSEDRKSFIMLPDKVSLIRRLFDMAGSMGSPSICRTFNSEGIPSFNGRQWKNGYIIKLIRGRTVLGEWQPGSRKGTTAVKMGDPIVGYYPAIIDQKTWDRANAAQSKRNTGKGRPTNLNVNMFKGLLTQMYTNLPMGCQDYGDYERDGKQCKRVRLVPRNTIDSGASIKGQTFLYDRFETAFLTFLKELKPSDFGSSERVDELASLSSALTLANDQIEVMEGQMGEASPEDIPSLVKVLSSMTRKREKVKKELALVKMAANNPVVETLADAQTLADMLAQSKEPDKLRERIRARLRQIVKSMTIDINDNNGARIALCKITFNDGSERFFFSGYSLTRKPIEIPSFNALFTSLEGGSKVKWEGSLVSEDAI